MNRRTAADASARLARFLSRTRRRLRLRRAIEAVLRSLPVSLAACALALIVLRAAAARGLLELELDPLLLFLAAVVALGAFGAALAGAARRFTTDELALLVDHELGTREALATATWLAGTDEAEDRAQRALAAVGDRSAAEALPWRKRSWRGLAISCVLLLLALTVPLPGAAPPLAPPPADPTVTATAAVVEERAREIAEGLEDRDAPEAVKRLLADLQDEAEALQRSPTSRETAALALRKLAQAVDEERERRRSADGGALERALSAMEQSSLTRRAARAAQEGNAQDLEHELASLAAAFREGVSFDEREIDRLSVRLREAADELRESSHEDLADRLDALAEALESGDAEAAAKLFEELLDGGLLEQAGNDAAAGEALAEAQALLRQALAQLGRARPDQLARDPAQGAAEALQAQAAKLEEAGATALAQDLREVAESLEARDLDRSEQLTEDLLSSGRCRNPTGSASGDAAAREAEALLGDVLAGLRRSREQGAAPGEAGAGRTEAWTGRRTRTGSPLIERDWGVGSTNEAAASQRSGGAGNQSDRQSQETSDWVEAYQALYESTRLEDAKGRATRVGGLVGEGDHVAVPVWSTASGPGQAQFPLVTLPPSYQRASEDALANETIPAGYRDSVRRYFESLGGGRPGEKREHP